MDFHGLNFRCSSIIRENRENYIPEKFLHIRYAFMNSERMLPSGMFEDCPLKLRFLLLCYLSADPYLTASGATVLEHLLMTTAVNT